MVSEGDSPVDNVADYRISTTFTYDVAGNLLEEATEVDLNGNGTIDSTDRTLRTYDGGGHVLTSMQESNDDGAGALSLRATAAFTYGALGELLRSTFDLDQATTFGGAIDGAIDVSTSATFTYDAAGNKVGQVVDELVGLSHKRETSTFVYDADGHVVTSTLTVELDGVLVLEQAVANAYNSRGQLVQSVSTLDQDGDGLTDSSTVSTTVYDGVRR